MKIKILLLFFITTHFLNGQKANPLLFGGQLSCGLIKGDVTNHGFAPGLGIFFQKNFSKSFIIGLELNKLEYQGSVLNYYFERDKYGDGFTGGVNDYKVITHVNQIGIQFGFNILPSPIRKENFQTFLFAGIGYMNYHSISNFLDMRDSGFCPSCYVGGADANPDYNTYAEWSNNEHLLYVPFGINFQYSFHKKYLLGLVFEGNYIRSGLLDNLDGHSYYNYSGNDMPLNFFLRFGVKI